MRAITVACAGVAALRAAMLALGFAAGALPASAQTYPSRPIHLIVGFAPGGTGDIVGRLIGNKLSVELGQSVVVENRAGAGGTIAAHDVANAAPDGYTLSVAQTPEIAINPFFLKDAGYDPLKDLQPIALAGVVPLALVVPASAPYSTMAELVTFLRTTDRPLTFASAGVGTPGHLAGELLKLKLNNKLTHVPYKGAAPALERYRGRPCRFLFPRISRSGTADASRQGQTACSFVGQALAGCSRHSNGRREHRHSKFRFHAMGRIFRTARHAEGSCREAQHGDQQNPA